MKSKRVRDIQTREIIGQQLSESTHQPLGTDRSKRIWLSSRPLRRCRGRPPQGANRDHPSDLPPGTASATSAGAETATREAEAARSSSETPSRASGRARQRICYCRPPTTKETSGNRADPLSRASSSASEASRSPP